ncbi:MAG: hypothetical protein BAJALOKI1v1_2090002 [Promethearchaeota archaeon]|nr:MAG: hypothetical protein BAJALOKI1v1_2090002 [Candidatus Lokiarchaeota archaeon]
MEGIYEPLWEYVPENDRYTEEDMDVTDLRILEDSEEECYEMEHSDYEGLLNHENPLFREAVVKLSGFPVSLQKKAITYKDFISSRVRLAVVELDDLNYDLLPELIVDPSPIVRGYTADIYHFLCDIRKKIKEEKHLYVLAPVEEVEEYFQIVIKKCMESRDPYLLKFVERNYSLPYQLRENARTLLKEV